MSSHKIETIEQMNSSINVKVIDWVVGGIEGNATKSIDIDIGANEIYLGIKLPKSSSSKIIFGSTPPLKDGAVTNVRPHLKRANGNELLNVYVTNKGDNFDHPPVKIVVLTYLKNDGRTWEQF